MNKEEARAKVMAMLETPTRSQRKLVIMDEYTKETPFGWAFFYQSYEFVHHNNDREMLIGHGPVFIDKDYDLLIQCGSRLSTEEYIHIYMENRGDREAFMKAI